MTERQLAVVVQFGDGRRLGSWEGMLSGGGPYILEGPQWRGRGLLWVSKSLLQPNILSIRSGRNGFEMFLGGIGSGQFHILLLLR